MNRNYDLAVLRLVFMAILALQEKILKNFKKYLIFIWYGHSLVTL